MSAALNRDLKAVDLFDDVVDCWRAANVEYERLADASAENTVEIVQARGNRNAWAQAAYEQPAPGVRTIWRKLQFILAVGERGGALESAAPLHRLSSDLAQLCFAEELAANADAPLSDAHAVRMTGVDSSPLERLFDRWASLLSRREAAWKAYQDVEAELDRLTSPVPEVLRGIVCTDEGMAAADEADRRRGRAPTISRAELYRRWTAESDAIAAVLNQAAIEAEWDSAMRDSIALLREIAATRPRDLSEAVRKLELLVAEDFELNEPEEEGLPSHLGRALLEDLRALDRTAG